MRGRRQSASLGRLRGLLGDQDREVHLGPSGAVWRPLSLPPRPRCSGSAFTHGLGAREALWSLYTRGPAGDGPLLTRVRCFRGGSWHYSVATIQSQCKCPVPPAPGISLFPACRLGLFPGPTADGEMHRSPMASRERAPLTPPRIGTPGRVLVGPGSVAVSSTGCRPRTTEAPRVHRVR